MTLCSLRKRSEKREDAMTSNGKLLLVLPMVLVLAACQGKAAPRPVVEQPTPIPTPVGINIRRADEIFGIWMVNSHPHYEPAFLLLRPDGTFTFSPNQDGGRPSESGKYWFEDGMLFIKDDFCPTPGKYSVTRQIEANTASLVIALVEDGCTARVKILTTAPEIWFGALP